ncbi:MAG: glycosyltransferase N-terminal domain-containing protein [Tepidisphaeraceae bacterium]
MTRYDFAYRSLLIAGAPFWLLNRSARAKVKDAFKTRVASDIPAREGSGPCLLIHAVSVGELNAAKALIERLRSARPELHVVVTTTTTTGDELARKLYTGKPGFTVGRFPIDLSHAMKTLLDKVRPSVCVLMEQEVWPNFVRECETRRIPVIVANGRISKTGFRNLKLARPLLRRTFGRLTRVLAQEENYADRYAYVGVPRDRIDVVGTMKFDTAPTEPTVLGSDQLAADMGIDLGKPLLVAGSTGPGEEAIVLDVYAKLRVEHPTLQLAIVPRHPPRFDEVANLIAARGLDCVRRSVHGPLPTAHRPVFLGDTMGELRKFYALATVVFVGRSLVDLGPKQHGSDMLEPAALTKPTIVGPFTGNFAEPMNAFRAAQSMIEVSTPDGLHAAIQELLTDPARATDLGTRARQVVQQNRGATDRHVERILELLK